MTTYEAMIITSTNEGGGAAWESLKEYITATIEARGGQVSTIEKWDERSLAYPINKEKRGVYTLVHFEAGGTTVQQVRRDFTLSERVLRVMLTVDEDEGRPDPMELLEGRKDEDKKDEKKDDSSSDSAEKPAEKAETSESSDEDQTPADQGDDEQADTDKSE